MLAKTFSFKVIQAVIFSINIYEQDMIAVGNENKKIKRIYRWDYFHLMPMLPLLGANRHLPLLHMAKRLFGLKKQKMY